VLYPFDLAFNKTGYARFPFIVDGNPVKTAGPGSVPPSCLISARAAGDMRFVSDMSETNKTPHGKIREGFFRSVNIQPEKVYSLFQVHSKNVFAIGGPGPSPAESGLSPITPAAFAREGDGMVSFCPDIFLAVTVADCLPVFLLDTVSGVFAALHSGWRGTGIVLDAIEMMREARPREAAGKTFRPENIAAVLGPCIQSCCYNVDAERAALFRKNFGENSAVFRTDKNSWFLDLQAANISLLEKAGIRNIAVCKDCTFTDKRLGSFRREGERDYTRMIAMVGAF
jgi:YfiH family protein